MLTDAQTAKHRQLLDGLTSKYTQQSLPTQDDQQRLYEQMQLLLRADRLASGRRIDAYTHRQALLTRVEGDERALEHAPALATAAALTATQLDEYYKCHNGALARLADMYHRHQMATIVHERVGARWLRNDHTSSDVFDAIDRVKDE